MAANSKQKFIDEVVRHLQDLEDLSEDIALDVIDQFEDDVENHFQQGSNPVFTAKKLAEKWDEQV